MYRRLLIFVCKVLMSCLRAFGRSGSALPGLVIERLYPGFLYKVLEPVESRVILVTGTNGKTTTTKMLVEGLRVSGAQVVTNGSGSNMTRGLIAAVVESMTYTGSLRHADWFVFEMDEAYAPVFTRKLTPGLLLALNVMRDQLDRYGELSVTAKLIEEAATRSNVFVYNSLDPLLGDIANARNVRGSDDSVWSFGVSSELSTQLTNEQTQQGESIDVKDTSPSVCLTDLEVGTDQQVLTVSAGSDKYSFEIPLEGFHNALNATGVAAVLVRVLPPESRLVALRALSNMPIPFGRGERLQLQGKAITVALAKNPSGLTANLSTFVKDIDPEVLLFVVNDKIADGRDVSWLWDVKFRHVISSATKVYVSGSRAYDMALRLQQDGIDSRIEISIDNVVSELMRGSAQSITIIPTYTALFEVRSALAGYGEVSKIW